MDDSTTARASARPTPPSNKAKAAVQRLVNGLLNELAPERTLTRGERVPVAVEQHRSPTGCVLQATDHAVSVSWIDESKGETLGELHVIVWRGTVARRGATRHTKGATIISEIVLHPTESPGGDYVWKATDGTRYDSIGLIAKILALLQEQTSTAR